MKKLSNTKGFTLIELMITLVILGILVAVAVPSMEDSRKKSSVRGHHRDFQAALSFARGEALSRGKNVTMCPSADAATCDTTDDNWSNGWIIYEQEGPVDDGSSAEPDAGDTLLRVYDYAGSNSARVVDPLNSSAAVDALSWNYRGFSVANQRALVVVCERSNDQHYARGLLLASSGRSVSTRDTDNDRIHETVFEEDDGTVADGELTCP